MTWKGWRGEVVVVVLEAQAGPAGDFDAGVDIAGVGPPLVELHDARLD
jgi:hypothetical protein